MAALMWVAARHDGQLFAIGGEDGRLRTWFPADNRIVATHDLGANVRRCEWSADGNRLVAIAGDKLYVFSPDGTRELATIGTKHDRAISVATHPTKPLAATTGDGFVRVWDLDTGTMTLEVSQPSEGTAVAMSETVVAAGWRSGWFTTWTLADGAYAAGGEVSVYGGYLGALAFDATGAFLMTGGSRGGHVLIDAATWTTVDVWKSQPPKQIATNSLQFAGERILAAYSDDTIAIIGWPRDRASSTLGTAFWVDRKRWDQDYIVSSACFVPTTKLVLTSHFTGTLRVWRVDSVGWQVGEVAFDAETPRLITPGDKELVAWWAALV